MDFIGDIDLVGLLSVVIFYLLILGVGMWAAGKKSNVEGVSEEVGIISQNYVREEVGIISWISQ